MESYFCCCMLLHWILLLSWLFQLAASNSSFSAQSPSCHGAERNALLQLKQSFLIKELSSDNPSIYTKVASWKMGGESSGDCCSWDGVVCDENTGHVIGLDLSGSFLFGSINSNSSLFHLDHLQRLDLSDNDFNYSQIPCEIGNLHRLNWLDLSNCNLSRSLPTSVGNLNQLTYLNLSFNYFEGQMPPHLTNSSNLSIIDLSFNSFKGEIPPWLGKLKGLHHLHLANNNFFGEIPYSIVNLTNLFTLNVFENQLTGKILSRITNLTELTTIWLAYNYFNGEIPSSIVELENLQALYLFPNNFSGTVEMDSFWKLKNLVRLSLSDVTLLNYNANFTNVTFPRFRTLWISSCNLREFPAFLRLQDKLTILSLPHNHLHGQIPTWVWNSSRESLLFFKIENNFITGFEQHSTAIPWTRIKYVNLCSNMFEGTLPIPPADTIMYYTARNNKLSGELPQQICHFSSLFALDLSDNKLSGLIPQCLGNISSSLVVLNLKGNNFSGPVLQTFPKGSKLEMLDLSQNQFQGQVPRALANCTSLQILDLRYNEFQDTFPIWLGALPKLEVLILGYNKFFGSIRTAPSECEFPRLRIIDLSNNEFTGLLPAQCFQIWNAMKTSDEQQQLNFMSISSVYWMENEPKVPSSYVYTMMMTNKGINMMYLTILRNFKVIDLSSNKFIGKIPESIGNLKGLHSLNLSNNYLVGRIQESLDNLKSLESLDLSRNKFTGEIPQQLASLTFLEIFNVSYNRLKGTIPRGKQFNTFPISSFEGNSGLCGEPLPNKCQSSESSPPLSMEHKKDSIFPSIVYWVVVIMGYASGLVFGLIIGKTLTTRHHDWFVETFGRKQQRQGRQNKKRQQG